MTDALPERALSLTGPWWWFMLHLPPEYRKTIENRSPGFSHKSFRGPCWVHATRELDRDYFDYVCSVAVLIGVPRELMPSFDGFPRGGIVGRCNVVRILPPPAEDRVLTPASPMQDRWRMDGQWGFVVEDARPVPFVACRGYQGFWRVPSNVLEQIRRAA
jgi:hypothetical protein